MLKLPRKPAVFQTVFRAFVAMLLVAGMVVTSAPLVSQPAQAQELQTLEVWGISGGIVTSPKEWKFRQSTSAANDLGSASAAAPSLNDDGWETRTLRWKEFPGPNVANHFRKDFDLDELGITLSQIQGIRVRLQYDDTAVLYLNGVEVYRSIRGNLDQDFSPYAVSDDFPFDVNVPFGGQEEFYVDIPNVNGANTCEYHGPTCSRSPYGGPNPPEIPVSLLNDGVNTWGITTWNQSGGGSGDSSLNHVFELLITEQPPNPIFINEVVASNDGSWEVQIDDDPALETPDWFELVNSSPSPVNMAGWTVSDSSASWVFPSVTIPAGGYLLVAASDNDVTSGSPLQTNFKLSSEGDTLKLTNPLGVVADEYPAMPQQFTDNSFGRPNDSGDATYLASTTPGAANSAAGNGYSPILRPFANRIYNQGESIVQQVNAFDPDGDVLTYTMSPDPSWLDITPDGLITGTATTPGTFQTTITVRDSDTDIATQLVQWITVPAVAGPVPIVMNEYNAVADDRELLGGSVVGNGGDWYEFVVIEDQLDLRGYTFEMWDRKGSNDGLRLAATVTFNSDIRLARVPAGTFITLSEENVTDLDFNAQNDWHINLQIDTNANGAFFAPAGIGEVFNSTRDGQTVLIKDASGVVVTPLSGETEAWDEAAGGVSGAEVMNLCVRPRPNMTLDPVADYRDNGANSTFGAPNSCVYTDPNNAANTITFNQNLGGLRSSATLGAQSGDVNCDLEVNVIDALLIARFTVGTSSNTGPCFFDQGGPNAELYVSGGDLDQSGDVNITDALIITRCEVGISLPWCP